MITKNKNFWVLPGFILFSIAIRFFSFFPSVIDHDESTYIVMGMEIMNGKTLYVDILDIKPALTYFIFALLSLSKSIIFIRLFGALVVALSAFQLFKLKGVFSDNFHNRVIAGFTFIILLSLDPILKSKPLGLAINTEIFFIFFTICSFVVLLKGDLKITKTFLAGIILGIGFMIKYVVLLEAMGIFLFLLVYALKDKKRPGNVVLNGIIYLLGVFIPFLVILFYFKSIGEYEAFYFATFDAPVRYNISSSINDKLAFIIGNHQALFTMLFFYLAFVFTKKGKEKAFIGFWFVFALVGMTISGKQFDHHRLQCFSAMAFCIPNLVTQGKLFNQFLSNKVKLNIAYGIIAANLIFYSIHYARKYYAPDDNLKKVANYINSQKRDGDLLYNTRNQAQIINFLTDMSTPTHMVHTSNFGNADREYVFDLNRKEECDYIYDAKPAFILGNDNICIPLDSLYQTRYKKDKSIAGYAIYIKNR